MLDRNVVAALLTSCLAVLVGCGEAEVEPASAVHGYPISYAGQTSLDERIVEADVVARVRMVSVEGGVEDGYYSGPPTLHTPVMRFRFRVLEYLKGSGGSEIVGVVPDHDSAFATAAEARAMIPSLLSGRDTRWDDREAVVFLASEAGGYRLGYVGYSGDDSFTVASRWSKNWLPEAASATTSGEGAVGQSGDKRFLLDDPSSGGASGAQGASGETAPTITLSALKANVAELQREVAAGDGSEEYLTCVRRKYAIDRLWRWFNDQPGGLDSVRIEAHIDSGLPAGSVAYDQRYGSEVGSGYWLGGRDGDLFTVVSTTVAGRLEPVRHHVLTARPTPAGEYRINFHVIGSEQVICGGNSEFVKLTPEDYVHVTAPAGVLHEAFFDPAALASGVGVAGLPGAFTVGGASTSIAGLEWENGSVVLTLSPHAALAGHALDFIDLNGAVTTTLAVSDATVGSVAGTYTWSVADQPWQAGDKLMLRIRAAAPDPAIAISGLDASIEARQSDDFTVSASNLATSTSYSIRLMTDDSDIGFDVACADRQQDTTVPAASTSASAAFTLHACSTTGGTVTATLRQGTTAVATTTQDVTVTAAPSPPAFKSSTYSFTVAENASSFHFVGKVSADDPDGGTVTYSIVAGNGEGKFEITHNNGEIVVWGSLDYDTTSSYALTVRATDSSGDTSTVVVNISDTDAP